MIQPRGAQPDTRLISFRVSACPDDASLTEFEAERIGDHRAEYLSFEGEVSGGRGTVRRVAVGNAEVLRDDAAFVVVLDGRRKWIGHRRGFERPGYHFHLSNGPDFGHTAGCEGV
jgi:hypothetical protein